MFWQLINSFFYDCLTVFCFSNWPHQKRFVFVLQRDEPEDWTSSLWTNTLELHQQDFRATNVIDWEECFANKTVETYIFLSLMSHSLNIYLNYINKRLMTKILMDVWMAQELCHQMNKTILEYVGLGEFLFDSPTYLKMNVVANLLFFIHMCIIVIVIIAISWSDHNSQ